MTDEVAGFANRFLFGHAGMTELFSNAYWRAGGSYVLSDAKPDKLEWLSITFKCIVTQIE